MEGSSSRITPNAPDLIPWCSIIGFTALSIPAGSVTLTSDLRWRRVTPISRQQPICTVCTAVPVITENVLTRARRSSHPAQMTTPRKDPICERCHSLKKNSDKEREFNAFIEKMPRKALGNGIDWEAAESSGLIKPLDCLEGISVQRPPIKAQKDFSIEANVTWMSDVIFSHKKHAFWNGCEVCHPEIFPIKKGSKRYTMLEIDSGEYCGVCHDKVAFPILDCQRCHTGVKY